MTSKTKSPPELNEILGPNPLHQAVGAAIEAYTMVEGSLALLLGEVLNIHVVTAHAVLNAIRNVRATNTVFEVVLEERSKGKLNKYWDSCTTYLTKLAEFRNALAHWHPQVAVYVSKDESAMRHSRVLRHPSLRSNHQPLEATEFVPFLKDCQYIREEISQLSALLRAGLPENLPENFQHPITRQNEAVLRQRKQPKGKFPKK
jgi:hypothetical protein